MPKRIQRKRTKGWRLPENAMCVDRSTMWGNPFRPYTAVRLAGFDVGIIEPAVTIHVGTIEECLAWYRIWAECQIRLHDRMGANAWLDPIRGKDLACWCPLGSECHSDVLLELANQ